MRAAFNSNITGKGLPAILATAALILTILLVTTLGLMPTRALANRISVQDSLGNTISLEQPAKRVITLAPHLVENLHTAGAFDRILATVSYSDYPKEAAQLPVIGSHRSYDYERIIAYNPDLVLAWHSGNGAQVVQTLRDLGLTVYVSEPKRLRDIPKTITNLGKLMGTHSIASIKAEHFLHKLAYLEQKYSHKQKVSSFFQIWHQPLQTLSSKSLTSHIISLCGGDNIFKNTLGIAPIINIEALLEKDPQVIIASQSDSPSVPAWQSYWLDNWQQLQAVSNNQLINLPADKSLRATRRLLLGAETLCLALDKVREKQ